jgi:hypothetical protein
MLILLLLLLVQQLVKQLVQQLVLLDSPAAWLHSLMPIHKQVSFVLQISIHGKVFPVWLAKLEVLEYAILADFSDAEQVVFGQCQ